mgnify:CR=1 FL=1
MLNQDVSLLWRDFKRVKALCEDFPANSKMVLDAEFLEVKENEERKLEKLISFMLPQTLLKVKMPEKFHIIMDEF